MSFDTKNRTHFWNPTIIMYGLCNADRPASLLALNSSSFMCALVCLMIGILLI